jgi:glyoxylase-like metal-dependent hydrolase (beta-lactamase superfamily II)
MHTRLFLLTCGMADLDQRTLTGRGAGARVRVPIPAYLLQSDGGTILFDTGMPDFCYTGDPRALAHAGEPDPPWAIPYGGATDTIAGQLATLGLRPADVDLVVNSHLHLDHCGGNRHFAHCPLLLRLPTSGVLLFTFDAVGTRALWEADELGAAADPATARASMDRLRAVAAQTGAQVVCGHDLEQWAALRHPPAYYD